MSKRSRYTKIPQLDVACSAYIKIKMNNVDSYDKEAQERISYDEKNIDKRRSYLNLFVHGFDEENEPIIDDQKYKDSLKNRIMKRIAETGAKVIFDKKEVKRAKTKKEYYTDRGHNTRESVISEGVIFQFSHELAMKILEEDGMLDNDGKIREGAELPKDGKMYKWIADTYKFACDKWGRENVVGAYLHLDEYTPHLHMFIVPLKIRKCTYAKKPILDDNGKQKETGTLNAKGIFSPKTIKQLWQDYAIAMKEYGATAARGLIPKDRYDNVASMQRMVQNISDSIDDLEEKENQAYNDFMMAEADVLLMKQELSDIEDEKKEYETNKVEYQKTKKELESINEDIEKKQRNLDFMDRKIRNQNQFYSSLKEAGFKQYMDELPLRIKAEIKRMLFLRGLYEGYSVDDVGKVDGVIAIKLTGSEAKSIILEIYPDGKTYANGIQAKRRDGTSVYLSEISQMFSEINPEARKVFDSIFLKSGHILTEHLHSLITRMPIQQSRRSNVDASRNEGEIEYGDGKKRNSIKI